MSSTPILCANTTETNLLKYARQTASCDLADQGLFCLVGRYRMEEWVFCYDYVCASVGGATAHPSSLLD